MLVSNKKLVDTESTSLFGTNATLPALLVFGSNPTKKLFTTNRDGNIIDFFIVIFLLLFFTNNKQNNPHS
jgi:hypothetical protein